MKCVSAINPNVPPNVCPEEYSNICNTEANDENQASGFPNDLCGCRDSTAGTTEFCTDDSKVCKADGSGTFGCQDCAAGECPSLAPRCDGGVCVCGTTKPYNPLGFNFMISNTCSGDTASDNFVCGATGAPCDDQSVNPNCLDDSLGTTFGDNKSTCKV